MTSTTCSIVHANVNFAYNAGVHVGKTFPVNIINNGLPSFWSSTELHIVSDIEGNTSAKSITFAVRHERDGENGSAHCFLLG